MEEVRALHRAVQFRPFLVTSGERFPVYRTETRLITEDGGSLDLPETPGDIAIVAAADVASAREVAPDDPDAGGPVLPLGLYRGHVVSAEALRPWAVVCPRQWRQSSAFGRSAK